MIAKPMHTPGPWKVIPCPVHAGKHPLHDCRWIATANAEVEMSPWVPNDWTLNDGSLICEMRDTGCQPHDARLIASAPSLLAACKAALAALSQPATYPADIAAAKKWLTDAVDLAEVSS